MTDWKTYKGQVPWSASNTANKSYYNEGNLISSKLNPVWNSDFGGTPVSDTHIPCGYWPQEDPPPLGDFTFTVYPSDKFFMLPLVSGSGMNMTVDWGDGSPVERYTSLSPWIGHNYATVGYYDIKLGGTFFWRCGTGSPSNSYKIKNISQWGCFQFTPYSVGCQFYSCSYMTITATDIPLIHSGVSLAYCFFGCHALVTVPNMGSWDVSGVYDMAHMFNNCQLFNQDISSWSVGNVVNMAFMFSWAYKFNANISGWNVGKVTNMASMFYLVKDFNANISGWNVSNVTDFSQMLKGAEKFDQNLGGWDFSKATTVDTMLSWVALSTHNYSELLKAWDRSGLLYGTPGTTAAHYNSSAVSARSSLVSKGWRIYDYGLKP